jgi:hypothetical protein
MQRNRLVAVMRMPAVRHLALEACTGCHVVSNDQPFAPLLKGSPDFREIANRPNVTADSLRRTIAALPQVPLRPSNISTVPGPVLKDFK